MSNEGAGLTPAEKREERFKRWLSPRDARFAGPSAAAAYHARVGRFIKAIKLEEPDRVPCILPAAFFPAYYAGTTLQKAIYDFAELKRAWLKFLHDFEADAYHGPGLVIPGRALEGLDFRLYKWPGHGLAADALSYQFAEGEYMRADEYDALIRDPSDFWLRTYIPRVFGRLEPFRRLSPLTSVMEIPMGFLTSYARPDVQAALEALARAGREMTPWLEAVGEVNRLALEAGYPAVWTGFAKAPFDVLGDTLRGTRGIMMDVFQRPDRLREAMARLTPIVIEAAIASADASGVPTVMMPLHKGADGFLSPQQFVTFYWPSLRQVILGLVDAGLVPVLFAEGSYNSRLDVVKDLPAASVIWYFDQTDMARAKQILGGRACLAGNVPASLIATGTPQAVKEHCRRLIEVCGRGGGYILTGGTAIDRCDPENLRAVMNAALEYGKYD